MGWEIRAGKRCYYRKVREGGRVRSVYMGSGERAEAAAREDAERRLCATGVSDIRHVKKEGGLLPVRTPKKDASIADIAKKCDVKKEEAPAPDAMGMVCLQFLSDSLMSGASGEDGPEGWLKYDSVRQNLKHPSQGGLARRVKARFPDVDIGENDYSADSQKLVLCYK